MKERLLSLFREVYSHNLTPKEAILLLEEEKMEFIDWNEEKEVARDE